jgi:hypothetical protein
MSDEYGTLKAFLAVVATWAAIFFGVWATPLDFNWKVNVDIWNTVLFAGGGLAYFDYKDKIPIGKEGRIKIWFWFGIVMTFLQAVMAFILNVAVWETVEIEGHLVVTYENMVSFLFGIMGTLLIVFVVYRVKNREKYMEQRRRIGAERQARLEAAAKLSRVNGIP